MGKAAWIGGFVAAEGSFTVHPLVGRRKFVFRVELVGSDRELVRQIREFVGMGRIETFARRKPHHDDVIRYVLLSLGDLINVLVPLWMNITLPLTNVSNTRSGGLSSSITGRITRDESAPAR